MKKALFIAALITTNCFAETDEVVPEKSFTICRSESDNECSPKTDYWAGCGDQTARINEIISTECAVKAVGGSSFVRKYTEKQLSSSGGGKCGVTAIRLTCVATTLKRP